MAPGPARSGPGAMTPAQGLLPRGERSDRVDFFLHLAPHILNGLSLGFLFALIALGFMLIIGVMELINLAHGSLFALGAYVAMVVIAPNASWWGPLGKWYLTQPLALRYVLALAVADGQPTDIEWALSDRLQLLQAAQVDGQARHGLLGNLHRLHVAHLHEANLPDYPRSAATECRAASRNREGKRPRRTVPAADIRIASARLGVGRSETGSLGPAVMYMTTVIRR